MRKLALLVVLAACASPAADRDSPSLLRAIGPSVVPLMRFPQGYGSCVCVRVAPGKAWFLTARHVVEDVQRLAVVVEGKSHLAVVESVHPFGDIAVVRVDADLGLRPVPIATSLPGPGERVVVLGFPGGRPFELRATEGRMGWAAGTLSAALSPGNSGGPVLWNGRIIGVATSIANVPLWHVSYYACVDRGWLRKQGVID